MSARRRNIVQAMVHPGEPNADVIKMQEARACRVFVLREWLAANPGWRTVTEAASGTGLGMSVVSDTVRDSPMTFTRSTEMPKDRKGHERWVIRRHHHLEEYDG